MRGLTQLGGAIGIHLALLVTILCYLPAGGTVAYEERPISVNKMSDTKLRTLMLVTHSVLILSQLCVQNNFFEGII